MIYNLYNAKKSTNKERIETGIIKNSIFVITLLVLILLPLYSIRNLKAAACTWRVNIGKKKETKVVIKSYVPYSIWVNEAVITGNVINVVILGRIVPIAIMIVFFKSARSLFISLDSLSGV